MTPAAKTFTKYIELTLRNTPEVLVPMMQKFTPELKRGDLGYRLIAESESASPVYRKILITAGKIADDAIASEDCIGIITLQSLGAGKTLLRIPPRSQWYINIAPETLAFLGKSTEQISQITSDKFYWLYDESCFAYFVEKISAELQRLGFKETSFQKAQHWFKRI